MPTYEYACSSCQHEWEFEQSIKDAALTECPSCHEQTARRQISRGTGFILKGGGWYADGYGSSGSSSGSSSGTKSSASSGATASSEKPSGGDKTPGSGDSKGKTAAA